MAMSGRAAISLAIIRPAAPAPISNVGTLRCSDWIQRLRSERSVRKRIAILNPIVKMKAKDRSIKRTDSGIWLQDVVKSLLPEFLLTRTLITRTVLDVLKATKIGRASCRE